jgi:hypothetical protein
MITIKDVPTKTPIPREEINRNCEGESVKASGSEPTTKDLNQDETTISFLFFPEDEQDVISVLT